MLEAHGEEAAVGLHHHVGREGVLQRNHAGPVARTQLAQEGDVAAEEDRVEPKRLGGVEKKRNCEDKKEACL